VSLTNVGMTQLLTSGAPDRKQMSAPTPGHTHRAVCYSPTVSYLKYINDK
jgi:hypothetical protein